MHSLRPLHDAIAYDDLPVVLCGGSCGDRLGPRLARPSRRIIRAAFLPSPGGRLRSAPQPPPSRTGWSDRRHGPGPDRTIGAALAALAPESQGRHASHAGDLTRDRACGGSRNADGVCTVGDRIAVACGSRVVPTGTGNGSSSTFHPEVVVLRSVPEPHHSHDGRAVGNEKCLSPSICRTFAADTSSQST